MKFFITDNKYKKLLHMNQSDEKITTYACTFYAPAINLAYNCGIILTEDDIKHIIHEQLGRGLYFSSRGGRLKDGIDAVYQYVVKNSEVRGWHVPKLVCFDKDESYVEDLLSKGYGFCVGYSVNKDFYKDVADGVVDVYENYIQYKGSYFKHASNVVLKEDECYLVDSFAYGGKTVPWLIACDLKELKEDLLYKKIYIFI